jgi:hypothetical protein
MKYLLFFLLMMGSASEQKPKDGTYTYSIAFEEYGGKTLGSTCTVIIKGDSIIIVHNGKANLTGKKGDVMDEGIIMKHIKTGKWIIAHPSDINAPEIGGCGSGPTIIDLNVKFGGRVKRIG